MDTNDGPPQREDLANTFYFIWPKQISLGDEQRVYTVGPWLLAHESEKVRKLAESVAADFDLWNKTFFDTLPPETLLIIEHGETLRIVIDFAEGLMGKDAREAFKIAKRWNKVLQRIQGYRIESEKDEFLAKLQIMVKKSGPAKVTDKINKYIASQLEEAFAWYQLSEKLDSYDQGRARAKLKSQNIRARVHKLLSFLFKEKADEKLDEAWQELLTGSPPFGEGHPLFKDELKDTILRTFQNRTKGQLHLKGGGEK